MRMYLVEITLHTLLQDTHILSCIKWFLADKKGYSSRAEDLLLLPQAQVRSHYFQTPQLTLASCAIQNHFQNSPLNLPVFVRRCSTLFAWPTEDLRTGSYTQVWIVPSHLCNTSRLSAITVAPFAVSHWNLKFSPTFQTPILLCTD